MSRLTLETLPLVSFFVARALSAARALDDDRERLAWLADRSQNPYMRSAMQDFIAGIDDAAMLEERLRQLRREVLLVLVARDATGKADYAEVVSTMSDLAEVAVSAVVRVHAKALERRFGVPTSALGVPQDFLVVGMGKLGGRELNVSSDIDLIFVFDEAGDCAPSAACPAPSKRLTNREFFERLSKKVIAGLSDISGAGFVFRVDMRLRPNGDAGPICVSGDMLEEYLTVQGREWERFAWLKSRVVNTPVFTDQAAFDEQVKHITDIVRPFVFRKYVDFNAISSLTNLHQLIRAETLRKEAGKELGIHVKLGRGGIREIEFLTQTYQIIRGGREVQLRAPSTLETLAKLAALGIMNSEQSQKLSEAYIFLRNLEHAIQYVDDQQTHRLPVDALAQARVAQLLGMEIGALLIKLNECRDYVSGVFDAMFVQQEEASLDDEWGIATVAATDAALGQIQTTLEGLGYSEAVHCAQRILQLMHSRLVASQGEATRRKMLQLVRRVAVLCAELLGNDKNDGAQKTFLRFMDLLEVIAGRTTYVALLHQYPAVCEKVARLLQTGAQAAQFLIAHPIVLDELVDERNLKWDNFTPVDWSGWQDDLWAQLREAQGDQETQMNIVRDAYHAAVFQLLVADLEGRFTVERLADQLSALADAVLEVVISLAWSTIASRHTEEPKFAVVAYGKLGGKELSYASDLDLIYLFDDAHPDAAKNYTRLVRRMMSWLTVQTSSGILFDVDLRLRPNGENGLVVSSFDMFCRYQRNEDGTGAWPWEHQALTRARFAAGDRTIGLAFEKEREALLKMSRDKAKVLADVSEMRGKMLEGHPNPTSLFDIKHDRGGMVDIEFAVQALVLIYSHDYPELVNNFGNILLLEMVGRLGLVDVELANRCARIYRDYRYAQRTWRLENGSGNVRLARETMTEQIADVNALWVSVFGDAGPSR